MASYITVPSYAIPTAIDEVFGNHTHSRTRYAPRYPNSMQQFVRINRKHRQPFHVTHAFRGCGWRMEGSEGWVVRKTIGEILEALSTWQENFTM